MNTNFTKPQLEFFRASMAHLPLARDFFTKHLTKDLLEIVNLDTLALEEGTFIEEAFKTSEADLLYSVKLHSDSTAYLYLLYKYDGEVDRMTAFRFECRKVQIIKNHIAQHPEAPLPLPFVFPVIFYTGEDPWTAPCDIFPLFGEQAALARKFWP